jgi:alcohol dehydrogenase class IV
MWHRQSYCRGCRDLGSFSCGIPKIEFGRGKIKDLGNLIVGTAVRAFLAIDPYLETTGVGEQVHRGMQSVGIDVVMYSDIHPNPRCFDVDKAGKIAHEAGCDLVIALGGGSTMDFGKGVAVVARNGGSAWQYTRRKDHTPLVPGPDTLPVVAIPTTAGTGSEATPYSVLSNPELREKSTIVHERITPNLAIIDPELMFSMPPKLTAFTGVDALAHAVESYLNVRSTPFSKMVGAEAIRLIAQNLPQAVSNPEDEEARINMAWASTLAGIAIAHASPTLPHALGQAAGGFVDAPHGASVAACLTEIMRISVSSDVQSFAEITSALDPSVYNLPLNERAEKSVVLLESLLSEIGCALKLGDLGLKESDIDRVTEIALTGYYTGIELHPKVVDGAEIKRIFASCL